MILNFSYGDMPHMMDWGPNAWIYLILGGAVILFVIVILLYFLFRSQHQSNLADPSKYEGDDTSQISAARENGKSSNETAYFCPNCGVQLEERSSKFCPICGSKL
ncbi:MAG: zinc-ribbon domain-containing protein [Candidatus Hermodarchaeota archaeon]